MRVRPQSVAAVLLAAGLLAASTGCRVERTRGQRHQVRALDAVLQAESNRLAAMNPAADPEAYKAQMTHINRMYSDLVNAMVRSATAEPDRVQSAEDALIAIADEARGLDAYKAWHPDTQVNFERQFWRNRLQPWQQWRGPGWQTNREAYVQGITGPQS
jgi:hypothetical protein